jgi:hypothetical protein
MAPPDTTTSKPPLSIMVWMQGANTASTVANPGHDGVLESICGTTTTRARILSRF